MMMKIGLMVMIMMTIMMMTMMMMMMMMMVMMMMKEVTLQRSSSSYFIPNRKQWTSYMNKDTTSVNGCILYILLLVIREAEGSSCWQPLCLFNQVIHENNKVMHQAPNAYIPLNCY